MIFSFPATTQIHERNSEIFYENENEKENENLFRKSVQHEEIIEIRNYVSHTTSTWCCVKV